VACENHRPHQTPTVLTGPITVGCAPELRSFTGTGASGETFYAKATGDRRTNQPGNTANAAAPHGRDMYVFSQGQRPRWRRCRFAIAAGYSTSKTGGGGTRDWSRLDSFIKLSDSRTESFGRRPDSHCRRTSGTAHLLFHDLRTTRKVHDARPRTRRSTGHDPAERLNSKWGDPPTLSHHGFQELWGALAPDA